MSNIKKGTINAAPISWNVHATKANIGFVMIASIRYTPTKMIAAKTTNTIELESGSGNERASISVNTSPNEESSGSTYIAK